MAPGAQPMKAWREWLAIGRNVLLVLAVIVIGELLPPLQALEQWIAPRRVMLAWMVGGVAGLGWGLLMGATLYRIFTGGALLRRDEIAEQIGRVKSYHSAPMAVARGWRYKIPQHAWGAGFSDKVSIAQMKAAWRQGLWCHDARWQGLFIMGLGAALMAVGLFGEVIVLGAPGLKLLGGGVLLYAAVRTAGAFLNSA